MIDIHQRNLDLKLKINKIKLGKINKEYWTIIQNHPILFLSSKIYEFEYIIKARKLILQFCSRKGLKSSKIGMLTFNSIAYLKLWDPILEIYDERKYAKLEDYLSNKTNLFSSLQNCLVLMNNDIDFITLNAKHNQEL